MQQRTLVLTAVQQETVVLIRVQQQTHTCFQVELLHGVHAAEGPQADATLKAGGLLQCCTTHTLRQTSPHCYTLLDRRGQDSTAQLWYTLVDRQRQTAQLCYILVDRQRQTEQLCCATHLWKEEAALLYASVR